MTDKEYPHAIEFIDNYFPIIDGVVETVHNYALNLHCPVVCPRMARNYNYGELPYEVLTCPSLNVPLTQYTLAVPRLVPSFTRKIAEKHPQILHTHSTVSVGHYAVSMGKKLGVPVVGTFHSKIYEAVFEFSKSRALAKMMTRSAVSMYENCDAVWACSGDTAETLRSYGYRGGITVMTNGTNMTYPDKPEELKARAAAEFGLPRGKHILLFVGQMVWYKNQRIILDAFRMLCDKSDDFCLVMTGEGRDGEAIRKYAEKLGLAPDKVLFTGKVADHDLLSGIYLNASLLFFPSVFDNTPLVLREAAALGIPALVTEGSNAAEPVHKNVNGFMARADAQAMCAEIERIFAVPGLVASAGRAARETIPVQWADLMPKVRENYIEIIEKYNLAHKK